MKTMKRFGCLLLVLAMVLALGVSAMAAPQTLANSENTEGSITINGAIANEKYTIYQIFDLTYTSDEDGNNTGESYSYKVVDDWAGYLKEYQITGSDGNAVKLFILTDNNYLDPESPIFDYLDDDEVVAALARDLLAYASDNDIEGTSVYYTATVDSSGNIAVQLDPADGTASVDEAYVENGNVFADLTFNNLSLGYYLVGTSLGSLCMLDSTNPDAVVNEKNSTPVISKHVYNTADENWEQEDHENNGTQVTYELDVEHITGAVNLVIHDSQPSELHEDWDTFAPAVTLVEGEVRTALIANENYVINLTGADDSNETDCSDSDFDEAYGCTFEIDFTGYDFSNVSDSAYIEVIYTATLETEGDIYVDDVEEIDNWAVVTFGSSSSSVPVEAEVYSFGFEIFKYTDQQDDGIDIITVLVYNDSVAGQQDYLYLALVGLDDEGEESVTYFAEFSAVDGQENTYLINDWIEKNRIYYIQETPFVILGYDRDSTTGEGTALSYVEEPDSSVTVENPSTLIFYYQGSVPSHDYVVLDEFGTASMEDDVGSEEYTYYGTVQSALSGAEFELTRTVTVDDEETTQTAYFLEETLELTDEEGNSTNLTKHMYLFEGWLSGDEEVPEGYTTTLVSDTTGFINIEGLNTGTYTLTEVTAPDGYNLLDGSIEVSITATYDSSTGALESHGVSYTYNEESGTGVVYVLNNAGSKLPGTGGIGTTIFYVVGAILVCGAVVLLVTKRRTSNKNQAEA